MMGAPWLLNQRFPLSVFQSLLLLSLVGCFVFVFVFVLDMVSVFVSSIVDVDGVWIVLDVY